MQPMITGVRPSTHAPYPAAEDIHLAFVSIQQNDTPPKQKPTLEFPRRLIMCYFEQTRWACGYWRWGHFRQQCNKEYRTGETCGLKLVYTTNNEPDNCKICKDIEKKQRKYMKLQSDIYRWQREGQRSASIEKAERDKGEVDEAIRNMQQQHWNRQYSMT